VDFPRPTKPHFVRSGGSSSEASLHDAAG